MVQLAWLTAVAELQLQSDTLKAPLTPVECSMTSARSREAKRGGRFGTMKLACLECRFLHKSHFLATGLHLIQLFFREWFGQQLI